MRKTYLETNKEVFNPELYVIRKALDIVLRGGGTGCEAGRRPTDPH